MEKEVLEEFGLRKSEIDVYLALLELGTTKVGNVIKKTGIVSSVVHTSLQSLAEKGLVAHIKKGKMKYYQAVSPDILVEMFDERRKNFWK